MSEAHPAIALCICTYDRYDVLAGAIESAADQSLSHGDFEILVIDNSPDRERSHRFADSFRDVANLDYVVERAPGLSNARNVAVRRAKAPVVAFMDDDAIASPTWAEELLAAFERFGAGAMVVGGRVEPIWTAPRPPWLHDALLGQLSVVDWGGETRIAGEKEWFAGVNIAFRVRAIVEHGGFPTRLGRRGSGGALLSNEEALLRGRIARAGGLAIYAPRAQVGHLVEPDRLTRAWFRRRAAWQAVSDFIMEPETALAAAKAGWPGLRAYFNALPPRKRTVDGLRHEASDPELFRWQVGAAYQATSLLLSGFEDLAGE